MSVFLALVLCGIFFARATDDIVLHSTLERKAYTEFNRGTSDRDTTTKLKYYERASIFLPVISAVAMNTANLHANTRAIYHHAISVLWSTSQRSSCISNFAMAFVGVTTSRSQLQSVLDDILEVAYQLDPVMATVHLNIGKVSSMLGDPQRALQSYTKILEFDSHHPLALLNIGNYYFELGDTTRSITWYNRSLRATDDTSTQTMILNNIGQAYRELGQLHNSIDAFAEALEIVNATDLHRLHDWTIGNAFAVSTLAASWKSYELTENSFKCGVESQLKQSGGLDGTFFDCFTYMLVRYPAEGISRKLAEHNCNDYVQLRLNDSTNLALDTKPLRVGYLSYDWRNHPMGRLTQLLVTQHNADEVTTFCFSYGPDDKSEERRYVERECATFVDYSKVNSDFAVASDIMRYKIDILVDLTSLTYKGRVGIALHKPAEIIINYLGYPGTTGCTAFNYAIVDPASMPVEMSHMFTEKLSYLPYTYQANSMPKHINGDSTNDVYNDLLLCSFNAIKKLEPNSFHVWMNIMQSLPKAKLVLLETDEYIKRNLIKEALFAGIHSSRVSFWPKMPWLRHLQRISRCSLVLDTFVYGAHTTASDVLWMGIPIVALSSWGRGEMPSKVASALVNSIGGLAKLAIVDSTKEYERTTITLGTKRGIMHKVARDITHKKTESYLFNNGLIQLEMEQSYKFMMNLNSLSMESMHIVVPQQIYFSALPLNENEIEFSDPLTNDTSDSPLQCNEINIETLIKYTDDTLRELMKNCPSLVIDTIQKIDNNIMACTNSKFTERLVLLVLDKWDMVDNMSSESCPVKPDDVSFLLEVGHNISIPSIYLPLFCSEQLANILHDLAMMTNCITTVDSLRYITAAYVADTTWRRKLNIGLLLQEFGYRDIGFHVASGAIVESHVHVPRISQQVSATRLTFYCNEYGNSWWPGWDPTFVERGGLGGSEEAVVFLAEAMASLGYVVSVYGEMTEGVFHNVSYFPTSMFNVLDPGDVFIAWRYPLSMGLGAYAKVKYLWLHDILDDGSFPSNISFYIDNVLVPSEYHASKLSEDVRSIVRVLPHGLSDHYIIDGPNLNNVFIYGSSPNRGLEDILERWPTIRAMIHDARLEVYYGFNEVVNARLAMSMGVQRFSRWRDKIHALLNQDGVYYFGTVDHRTLTKAYAHAGFVLYPTRFPETGCISMIKAMAMGAIPITSRFMNSVLLQLTSGFDLVRTPLSINASFSNWMQDWQNTILETKNISPDIFRGIRTEMKSSIRNLHIWGLTARKLHASIVTNQTHT